MNGMDPAADWQRRCERMEAERDAARLALQDERDGAEGQASLRCAAEAERDAAVARAEEAEAKGNEMSAAHTPDTCKGPPVDSIFAESQQGAVVTCIRCDSRWKRVGRGWVRQ